MIRWLESIFSPFISLFPLTFFPLLLGVWVWKRLCFHARRVTEVQKCYADISTQEATLHHLLLRWLKIMKLFLGYDSDPTILLRDQSDGFVTPPRNLKKSALSIFNDVFSTFDHPLVHDTRNY